MSHLQNHLEGLTFGDIKTHENMSMVPLFSKEGGGPDYIVLKEALEKGALKVSEISTGGSVGELKVKNKGKKDVLILDGEELQGAKQNRVLNTTILIAAKSEEIIPVSCTEQGRWAYESAVFADSGNVMSPNIRSAQSAAVARSLKRSNENTRSHMRYGSNQSETWDNINRVAMEAEVHSETGAMSDIFKEREKDINNYLEAFDSFDNQIGLAVIIDSKVMGLDTLSKPVAYKTVHKKLIKSYAMEALLTREKKTEDGLSHNAVELFIDQAKKATESEYESVSLGNSIRLKGDRIVGSALEHNETIVHSAFFRFEEYNDPGPIIRAGRRSYHSGQVY